jgi:hypothetical protein
VTRRRMIRSLVVAATLAGGCGSHGSNAPAAGPTESPSSPQYSSGPSPTPTRIQIPPIPGGTYQTTVTRADAMRFGVFRCDPSDVDENTGHITLTLRAGRFRWVMRADHPIFNPLFTGVYSGDGKRVTFIFDPNTADESADTLQWSFDGSSLRFKVLTVEPVGMNGDHLCVARMVYQAHPWTKTR